MLIWKIVFWISTALILVAVFTIPFTYIAPEATDIIAMAVQIFGQFCIYGYAYQNAIGTKKIAILAFLLNLALSIYSLIEAAPLLLEIRETQEIIVATAAICVVVVLLIPLYGYSFKSEHIWKHAA